MITGTFTIVDELQSYRHGHLSLHIAGEQQLVQEKRAATVGSRQSPTTSHESAGPAQQGHRTHRQCTATGESQWSAERDQGNLQLRHDREIDDLSLQHNGNIHHFVDELRKHHPLLIGNCGNLSGMITETLPVPSIYIPPWAGGAPLKTSNAPSA